LRGKLAAVGKDLLKAIDMPAIGQRVDLRRGQMVDILWSAARGLDPGQHRIAVRPFIVREGVTVRDRAHHGKQDSAADQAGEGLAHGLSRVVVMVGGRPQIGRCSIG
jgi:hypothetical protein